MPNEKRYIIPSVDTRLGRNVRHDLRSVNFAARGATSVRRDIRHRNYSRYKLDQGALGACTGFAAAQALNSEPYRELRRSERLFVESDGIRFYSLATQVDDFDGSYPPTDEGSSGLGVAKALQSLNLIKSYEWAFGYDHGVSALKLGPLLQGTVWTENMFNTDTDGRVHPTGEDAGGHEYVWIGLEVVSKLQPSKDKSWFLNSWEDERRELYWGVNGSGKPGPGGGYFYMTRDDHSELLQRDGDLVRLVV